MILNFNLNALMLIVHTPGQELSRLPGSGYRGGSLITPENHKMEVKEIKMKNNIIIITKLSMLVLLTVVITVSAIPSNATATTTVIGKIKNRRTLFLAKV